MFPLRSSPSNSHYEEEEKLAFNTIHLPSARTFPAFDLTGRGEVSSGPWKSESLVNRRSPPGGNRLIRGPAGGQRELTWKIFQEKLSRAFGVSTRYVGEIHQVLTGSSHFLSQNLAGFLVRSPEGVGWH